MLKGGFVENYLMKIIMRTTLERDIFEYDKIPGILYSKIEKHDAYENFQNALLMAGNDPALHLEDDIIFNSGFIVDVNKIIGEHKASVIQFFSMRGDDLTIGTRYINGARFIAALCFYLPIGMSADILNYSYTWERREEHPTGSDLMVADYLKKEKIKYLNICPNLVDHKVAKSLINSKRSSKRVSLTFKKEGV